MQRIYNYPRLEDGIIACLKHGKVGFHCFRSWFNLTDDAKHLIGALDISLAQMRNRMYYGDHTQEAILWAKQCLSENRLCR